MKTIFAWLIILMFLGSGFAYAGDYTSSAHGNSTSGVDRAKPSYVIDEKYADYSPGNCAHCHEAHASLGGAEPLPDTDTGEYGHAGPDEALLFSYEEGVCETCHDGNPVAENIKEQIDKANAHPTDDYSGRHSVSESTTTDMDPGDYDPTDSLHAECVDCHNPHAVGSTVHAEGTNAVSSTSPSPLYKVSGVNPPTTSAWGTPVAASYTEKPTSTGIDFEYELCYKCHSSWTGPNDPVVRDTAKEFNPANASYHPVEAGLNTGSDALDISQMLSPWNVSVGSQTMYCSDCHGSETSGDPVGPHGSTIANILKRYWPLNNAATPALWTLGDAEGNLNGFSTDCLCTKCHPVYASGWKNNAHNGGGQHFTNYTCVQCHVGLPHGSQRQRLIAYVADPAPYDYNNNSAENTYFSRATTPDGYSDSDCNNGCSGRH